MAPIDRAEHRQQRMRGAGVANVQTNFSFNLGGLSRPAKQASVPPQRRSRTPRSATPTTQASGRKHRSASAPRSVRKSTRTPQPEAVTPQLGKRKRGSNAAIDITPEDEVDELSPEHAAAKTPVLTPMAPPARATVSPIREEREGSPDELSVADVASVTSSARKGGASPEFVRETPIPTTATPQPKTKASSPKAESARVVKQLSPQVRPRTTSADPKSSSRTPSPKIIDRPTQKTPTVEREVGPEDEDELSTPNVATAPARRSKTKSPHPLAQDDGEVDELSPSRPDAVAKPASPERNTTSPAAKAVSEEPGAPSPLPRKRGQPKRATVEPSGTARSLAAAMAMPSPAPTRQKPPPVEAHANDRMLDVETAVNKSPPQISRQKASLTENAAEEQDGEGDLPVTRAVSRPRRSNPPVVEETTESVHQDDDEMDELSLEGNETTLSRTKSKPRKMMHARLSLADKDETMEEAEPDSESDDEPEYQPEPSPAPRPHVSPKQKPRQARQNDKPPRKRQKRGPTQAISAMRLKGFVTKGLSVVDTTRTVMEDWTTHRINRLTEKLSKSADPASSRALRRKRHLILEYREKLDDVLLDLQDANNTASSNAVKLRTLKRQARDLRNEYLQVQRDRETIALEQDEIDEAFTREKREREARERLSASLFDIQAAIEKGKERARREGRLDEGPEMPLKMVMEDVARAFGAAGGLLGRVKGFNGVLEGAAKMLEGRV